MSNDNDAVDRMNWSSLLKSSHTRLEGALPHEDAQEQSQAGEWFIRARTQIRNGQWREALESLESAPRSASQCSNMYLLRAAAYFGIGDERRAIADSEKATDLSPESALAWAQRAFFNSRQGKYREAAMEYSQAIHLAASHTDQIGTLRENDRTTLLLGRATCFTALKEYEDALIDLDAAVDAAPLCALPYQHRGWVHKLRLDYERSINDYTAAIHLAPSDPHALLQRSAAYAAVHRFHDAIVDCERAICLAPSHPGGWVQRGYCLRSQREYVAAIADYNEAMRLASANAALRGHAEMSYLEAVGQFVSIDTIIRWGRASCLLSVGEYQRALDDLNKVVELHPSCAFGFARRAHVYRKAREFCRAWSDCEEALTLDENCALAINVRGSIHAHFRRDEQAIADFSRSLELDPRDAWSYANRGLAYFRLRQFARAVEDCTQALYLSPRWAEAFERRALAYFRLGEWQSAIDDFTSALQIKPELNRALRYRSFAREAIGDYAGAAQDRLAAEGLLPNEANEDTDP